MKKTKRDRFAPLRRYENKQKCKWMFIGSFITLIVYLIMLCVK